MVRMHIPEKLLPLHTKQKRYKIVIGGRGSGKTISIADLNLMHTSSGKVQRTAYFREFQTTIHDSVHSVLRSEINRLEMQGFDVLDTTIRFNGQDAFRFRGLARDPEGIKGMHDYDRFCNEEAQTLSYRSMEDQAPTLRKPGSEIWMNANPRSRADPFSQRFINPYIKQLERDGYYEDDDHLIIKCNYCDIGELFPDVLERERAIDEKRLSTAEYRHKWLGDFYDEVQNSIIPVEWFEAAIDAHEKLGFKPSGQIVCAFDPADVPVHMGGDSKGFATWHGSLLLDVDELETGDAAEGMAWAIDKARTARADLFVWDCDGLGAALKRQVDQELGGSKIDYHMFKGSMTCDNPDGLYQGSGKDTKKNRDIWYNKRAQYWGDLRSRFEATYQAVSGKEYRDPDGLISISSSIKKIDQLRAEICRIPRKHNTAGKFQVLSKPEMAAPPYSLPSPNMGDAVMMGCFRQSQVSATWEPLNFRGW
jgi:phage terminase large subunit